MTNKVYVMVTERILTELERGVVPWKKPWLGSSEGPRSFESGKPYSLLNQMILKAPGAYVTLKKLRQLGGWLKKGAARQQVVFWKIYKKQEINKRGESEEKVIPVLRYYDVYHVDFCEGLPKQDEIPANVGTHEIHAALENLKNYYMAREMITLIEGGERAFYRPKTDEIYMPNKVRFLTLEGYYGVLFHEIVHSTGHKTRLGRLRTKSSDWDTANYGYDREELVAEMGSAFLLHQFGFQSEEGLMNSSSYIHSWSEVFRQDPKVIIHAASQAEKAVKFVFG